MVKIVIFLSHYSNNYHLFFYYLQKKDYQDRVLDPE